MKRMQLVVIMMAVVFLQVLVALPFLVDKLGGRYVVVGWLGGVSQFSYAIASILLHSFVHRLGERLMLRIVLPTMAVCSALFAIVPTLPLLFLLVIVLSVVLALFWISMECLFSSQSHEENLLRNLARYCLSFSLGDAVGAWSGTALVGVDLRLPFLTSALLVLVCWGLLLWLERSGKLERPKPIPPGATQRQHGGERFLPVTRTLFFFICSIMGITFFFVPLVLTKEFPHWEGVGARIITLQPILQVCVFLAMGRWDRWVHKRWPLWLCSFLMIVATGLIAAAFSPSLAPDLGAWCLRIGLSLVGASLAVSYLMNLLYSMERPETRARNSGIHEAIGGSGMCLGPVLAGYGAQAAGRGAGAFWVAGALAVLGLILSQAVWVAGSRRRARLHSAGSAT